MWEFFKAEPFSAVLIVFIIAGMLASMVHSISAAVAAISISKNKDKKTS